MSLYPEPDKWQDYNDDCIANINDMISRYGSEVMICETGMPGIGCYVEIIPYRSDHPGQSYSNQKCLGVFYWEPEAYNGWKGYSLGAFDNSGKPTVALDAFK